ncbi:SGNH/GDSL hydrolase family protein [Salinibacillus xinjiangensis]|nr:GDSL-type esterase/lipase family protein [Salinibacillus xinjiangensis]
MMKKIISVIMVLLVSLPLFSTHVLAKEGVGKESLVALGDSIPYGYNLEKNNQHPSRDAYPYLIGDKANLRVRNLGEPGWTTEDLLASIQGDQKYRQAIRHSDYITLSIGSNDLLRGFRQEATQAKVMELVFNGDYSVYEEVQDIMDVPDLVDRMETIISEIRALSDSPIVFYNIYNPYPSSDFQNHMIGSLLLHDFAGGFNSIITSEIDDEKNVVVVDAYEAMIGEDSNLIPGDIHPTELGQERLAEIGYEVLR